MYSVYDISIKGEVWKAVTSCSIYKDCWHLLDNHILCAQDYNIVIKIKFTFFEIVELSSIFLSGLFILFIICRIILMFNFTHKTFFKFIKIKNYN